MRWNRSDVAGIIAPENVPSWARLKLQEMGIPLVTPHLPISTVVSYGEKTTDGLVPAAGDLPPDGAGLRGEPAQVVDTANHTKIYMAPLTEARETDAIPAFHESQNLNIECAKGIEKAINDSRAGDHHYNLRAALDSVTAKYGTERVHMVLANTMDRKSWDGRFSHTNRDWGNSVVLPDQTDHHRSQYVCESHPALLDGFINHARKAQQEKEKRPSVMDQLKAQPKASSKKGKKPSREGER